MKRILALVLALLLLLPAGLSFAEEEAKNITDECTYHPGCKKADFKKTRDSNYKTYWKSYASNSWFEVEAPEGEKCSAITIKWYDHPSECQILTEENGNWTEVLQGKAEYYAETFVLPTPAKSIRVSKPEGASGVFYIAEIQVWGEGSLPRTAQCWEPSTTKADLMLIVAHPDDEVIWFGGLLPTYAGEKDMAVQVCMMVPTTPVRRLELLDSLWLCGVENYPVWANFPDCYSNSLKRAYKYWDEDHVLETIVGWYRRFQPSVVLTHDINGEYGHGAHRVCADACMKALLLSTDAASYPDSAETYGLWDVPKLYLHSYTENVLRMDWRQPLDFFDGRCGEEIAQEAFKCHHSQQKVKYRPEDSGQYDNSLFGLYRSTVGDDDPNVGDFFQNIPQTGDPS